CTPHDRNAHVTDTYGISRYARWRVRREGRGPNPRARETELPSVGERDDRLRGAHGLRRGRLRADVCEQRLHLLATERLALEQHRGDPVERRAVLDEQPQRVLVRLVGEPRLLAVPHSLGLLGER